MPREVRDFIQQAEGRRVVGALAAFDPDPSLVAAGEGCGLSMLGLCRNEVEILNSPSFESVGF